MKIVHQTPLLHGTGSTGEATQWQGFAAIDDSGAEERPCYFARFGRVGGTIQQSKPTYTEPKNVGRSNETSSLQQAVSEINAKAAKKMKEDYLPVGAAPAAVVEAAKKHQERIKPMLAPSQAYPALKSHLKWPLYIQPKFDGMRYVTNGEEFWSRQGNLQKPESVRHLQHDTKGLLIDGEVIVPNASFQQTMEARSDSSGRTVFMVFDVVDLKLPFEERFKLLEDFMRENPHPSWVLTATQEISTHDQAMTFYEKCIELGMEGAMLRNKSGLYRPDVRSKDLQKMKAADDDEFEIVGYEEASGGWAGTPVFKLRISEKNKPGYDGKSGKVGAIFKAKPAMSYEAAAKLFKQCEAGEIVGQPGTVVFQGYYDQKPGDPNAGKPRCPRFKAVRNYE